MQAISQTKTFNISAEVIWQVLFKQKTPFLDTRSGKHFGVLCTFITFSIRVLVPQTFMYDLFSFSLGNRSMASYRRILSQQGVWLQPIVLLDWKKRESERNCYTYLGLLECDD